MLCHFFRRGFGFVTFQDPNTINDVVSFNKPHVVDKKTVRFCFVCLMIEVDASK